MTEPLEVLNGTNQTCPLSAHLDPSSFTVTAERRRVTMEILSVSGLGEETLLMRASIQRGRERGHEDRFQPLDRH